MLLPVRSVSRLRPWVGAPPPPAVVAAAVPRPRPALVAARLRVPAPLRNGTARLQRVPFAAAAVPAVTPRPKALLVALRPGWHPAAGLGRVQRLPFAAAAVVVPPVDTEAPVISLTLRPRGAANGLGSIRTRQVAEGTARQGAGESLVYALTTTPWASDPTDPQCKCYLGMTDVSSTVLTGSASADGDVITSPRVAGLTAGGEYRLEFAWEVGSSRYIAWVTLVAERTGSYS